MKKLNVMTVAVLAMALASCQSGAKKEDVKSDVAATTEVTTKADTAKVDTVKAVSSTILYQGKLPAADCPGIVYKLAINDLKDSTANYVLDMTYLQAENGKDKLIEKKGMLATVKGTGANSGKNIYKLTPDDKSAPTYFLVKDAQTLRLLNNKMEEPKSAKGLNYDLALLK